MKVAAHPASSSTDTAATRGRSSLPGADELTRHIRAGRPGPRQHDQQRCLRIGEVLALYWNDFTVNTDQVPALIIHRTIIKGKAEELGASTVIQDDTKSGASRIVSLADIALSALEALPRNGTLVFGTRNDTPISSTNFARVWDAVRTLAELPENVTFHAIRRTVATQTEEDYGLAVAAKVLGDTSRIVVDKHYVKRANQVPDMRSSIDKLIG